MATQTLVTTEQILSIPLASIQLSKTNPRKMIDPKALADLAADIKHRGVQEPVVVRPLPGSSQKQAKGCFRGPYCPTSCGANLPNTESSSWMKGLQFLAKTIPEHTPKIRA